MVLTKPLAHRSYRIDDEAEEGAWRDSVRAKIDRGERLINRYAAILLNSTKLRCGSKLQHAALRRVADVGGRPGGNRRVTEGRREVFFNRRSPRQSNPPPARRGRANA